MADVDHELSAIRFVVVGIFLNFPQSEKKNKPKFAQSEKSFRQKRHHPPLFWVRPNICNRKICSKCVDSDSVLLTYQCANNNYFFM